MKNTAVVALLSVVTAAGCASLTPTYKTEAAFAILDVKAQGRGTRQSFLDDVTQAIQTNMSQARITRSIPSLNPPSEPGRFTLVNPFAKSGFGALMAQSAIPSCEGALMMVNSSDSTMSSHGEQTSMSVCVWEYSAGYHIDIYVNYTEVTGGISPQVLGATIAKNITGSSAQFIPRTINSIRSAAEQHGAVKVIDSYIPESFKGKFRDATGLLTPRG